MYEHLDAPNSVGITPDLRARVDRAARRARRRRRAVILAVASLPAVVVAGSAILLRSRPDQLDRVEIRDQAASQPAATSVPVSTAPQNGLATSPDDEPDQVAATTAVVSAESATATGSSPAFSNATPARVVPSTISWSVIEASSPQALTDQFDASHRYELDPVPFIEDVAVDSPEMNLYEQVNGTWKQVAFNNAGILPVVSGDTVYGISSGTGKAGNPAAPSFGTFDVVSGTWRLHEVPEQIRPYQSANVESTWAVFGASPIDGGVIVSVNTTAKPRPGRFADLPQSEDYLADGPYVEGNTLTYFVDCDYSSVTGADLANPELTGRAFARRFCTEKTFNAAQLGFTQADLDALAAPYSLWMVTADAMVPFTSPVVPPQVAQNLSPADGMLLPNTYATWPVYTIGVEGSVVGVFDDVADGLQRLGGGNIVARGPVNGSAVAAAANYLLTASPGAPTQITDLIPAVTPPNSVAAELDLTAVGNTGTTNFATGTIVYDDPTDDAAATTLTDAGYSLVIADGEYRVLDDSTGAALNLDPHANISDALAGTLPQPIYWVAKSDSGKVALYSAGTPTSNFDVPIATFDLDWSSLPDTLSATRSIIVTSSDGVNVAIDDPDAIVRDAVGLGDNMHVVVHSKGPTTANGKIVIPVVISTVQDMDLAGIATPNQHILLLVGTPK